MRGIDPACDQRGCSPPLDYPFNCACSKLRRTISFSTSNKETRETHIADQPKDLFRVTRLGTGAPPPRLDRFGPSTLVEAGKEKLIFDAGRGAMQRLHQLNIPFTDIT